MHYSTASARLSAALNRWIERVCAAILAVLVVDIWIGVFGRYVFELPVTWAEELARYLMIWASLLAVSCGIARREHVAVTALISRLPDPARRWVAATSWPWPATTGWPSMRPRCRWACPR